MIVFQSKETPLHWARAFGRKEIARILLAHGADKELREDDTNSPALNYRHSHVAKLIDNWNYEYDPSEDPMQQLALMISRNDANQVKVILDKNLIDLKAEFTLVSKIF